MKWYEILIYSLMIYIHIQRMSPVCTFMYYLGINLFYMICILPDHDMEETRENESLEAQDWGEIQVRNTGNFSNGNWYDLYHHFFGGINY